MVASSYAAAAAIAVLPQCISFVHSFSGTALSHRRTHARSWRQPLTSYAQHDASSSSSRITSALGRRGPAALFAATGDESAADEEDEAIDVSTDPRLRRLRLPRALGIDWGTDLSFSFVYVRDLEPSGAAALSGEVEPGDQICELRPVMEDGEAINLIGAPFDEVMGAFASLGREVTDVELVFFRGTKEELKELCAGGSQSAEAETITITVVQNKGSKDEATKYIEAKAGCNVRQVLTDNGINVYQSVTRWTNCKGKQLCGTCIVNIAEGGGSTNRKSLDEASTLRENPESYRLSCVTFAYGDVTIETFPPIKAAQWTR